MQKCRCISLTTLKDIGYKKSARDIIPFTKNGKKDKSRK